MIIVLNFRAFSDAKSHSSEEILYPLDSAGDGVQTANINTAPGQRHINFFSFNLLLQRSLLKPSSSLIKHGGKLLLHCIDESTGLGSFLGGQPS